MLFSNCRQNTTKRVYLEQFLHFVVAMTNKNGSYVSRLQIGDIIETFHELRSYQNSWIHEEKDRFSRFHEGFCLFSRITNDIVFTISRTLFFNFTIFTNKKTAFTTSRNPVGASYVSLNTILNCVLTLFLLGGKTTPQAQMRKKWKIGASALFLLVWNFLFPVS